MWTPPRNSIVIFTTRKNSCGKVMFSQACVIPSVWGDGVSLHAMGQAEVCIPACNGVGVNFWYDLLLWPSGVAFWCGLLVCPSGVAFYHGLLAWPSGLTFCYGLLMSPIIHTPPHGHPPDTMVNKQAVCILLECFLVLSVSVSVSVNTAWRALGLVICFTGPLFKTH